MPQRMVMPTLTVGMEVTWVDPKDDPKNRKLLEELIDRFGRTGITILWTWNDPHYDQQIVGLRQDNKVLDTCNLTTKEIGPEMATRISQTVGISCHFLRPLRVWEKDNPYIRIVVGNHV